MHQSLNPFSVFFSRSSHHFNKSPQIFIRASQNRRLYHPASNRSCSISVKSTHSKEKHQRFKKVLAFFTKTSPFRNFHITPYGTPSMLTRSENRSQEGPPKRRHVVHITVQQQQLHVEINDWETNLRLPTLATKSNHFRQDLTQKNTNWRVAWSIWTLRFSSCSLVIQCSFAEFVYSARLEIHCFMKEALPFYMHNTPNPFYVLILMCSHHSNNSLRTTSQATQYWRYFWQVSNRSFPFNLDSAHFKRNRKNIERLLTFHSGPSPFPSSHITLFGTPFMSSVFENHSQEGPVKTSPGGLTLGSLAKTARWMWKLTDWALGLPPYLNAFQNRLTTC